jgi:hypothetical protein
MRMTNLTNFSSQINLRYHGNELKKNIHLSKYIKKPEILKNISTENDNLGYKISGMNSTLTCVTMATIPIL